MKHLIELIKKDELDLIDIEYTGFEYEIAKSYLYCNPFDINEHYSKAIIRLIDELSIDIGDFINNVLNISCENYKILISNDELHFLSGEFSLLLKKEFNINQILRKTTGDGLTTGMASSGIVVPENELIDKIFQDLGLELNSEESGLVYFNTKNLKWEQLKNDNAHKTAITRKTVSMPTRYLIENDLLKGRILDYGCGKGFDADTVNAEKYEPSNPEWSEIPEGTFDTIYCNYVLNVVDEETENVILDKIRSLLNSGGTAYISVRRDIIKDGWTSKKTYQRTSSPKLEKIKENSNFAMFKMTK